MNMSTPNRFLRRIARTDKKTWKETLETKNAEVLIAVAKHFGHNPKKKADAVEALLKEVKNFA
jgi:hypothetical protein